MPSSHHKSGLSRRSHSVRALGTLVGAVFAVLMTVPAAALAAPPALQAPAAAASVVEGKTVTYSWTGELLGAESTTDQSYFKIEVIDAAKAPNGQQAVWPDPDTFKQTEPGQSVTSIDLGAPPAGSWKWRVCAWGVVDPVASLTVQQIPNGCSPSRTLTSATALGDANKEVQVIEEKRNVTVTNAPTIIEKVRPNTTKTTPAATAPLAETVDPAEDELTTVEPVQPVKIQKREAPVVTAKGTKKSSIVLSNTGGLGDIAEADNAASTSSDSGTGDFSGALASGLGATIPGIPIPFWVLLFVIACVPIAIVWRRSVLAMFEWSDGSIDGFGTPDTRTAPVLAKIQPAQGSHAFGGAADVAATPGTTITEATTSHRAA